MTKKLSELLSDDLKNFLEMKSENDYSEFSDAKIFTSAYLHMSLSFGLFIGPESVYQSDTEEIDELWGLTFCSSSDYERLKNDDPTCLKGMSKKLKIKFFSGDLKSSNTINQAIFVLFKESNKKDQDLAIENDLSTRLEKNHHKLSWGAYSMWWKIDHIPVNVALKKHENTELKSLTEVAGLGNVPFVDPFKYNFDEKGVLSSIGETEYTYTRDMHRIPTIYWKKVGGAIRGSTVINQLPDRETYQKRKLVRLMETDGLHICGSTAIPILKNYVLYNAYQSGHHKLIGAKFVELIKEKPSRNVTLLKGCWLAVYLQNNVISHFLFEVLKQVLYAARIARFGLLITGVKPAPHIMEFFTVDSVLKDRITAVKISDPDVMYKPEVAMFCFEDHREVRPEDALNFQWYGQSILDRNKGEDHVPHKKIYISRRDSSDSRVIINENQFVEYLKIGGVYPIKLENLDLVQKLSVIKNAEEIITPAGAGILFRNLVVTENSVTIISSDTMIWNDFSLFQRATGWRNEVFYIFEREKSLGSDIYANARNHASIKIHSKAMKKNPKIENTNATFSFMEHG